MSWDCCSSRASCSNPHSGKPEILIFDPVIPIPWILVIAAAVTGTAAFYQFRSARRLAPRRSAFLLVARLSALAIIVLLLLQPSREEKVPVPARDKSVIFAIDNSASMREPHGTGSSRIDAVRADLEKAGVTGENDGKIRFFSFAETAAPTTASGLRKLDA